MSSQAKFIFNYLPFLILVDLPPSGSLSHLPWPLSLVEKQKKKKEKKRKEKEKQVKLS